MPLSEELDNVSGTTAGTVDRHDTQDTFESHEPGHRRRRGRLPGPRHGRRPGDRRPRPRTAAEQWAALGFDGRQDAAGRLAAATSPGGCTSSPTWSTARTASRTPTRSSRSPSPSTTSPGPRRTRAKVLGPRRVAPGLLAANHAAYLEYQPLGVVGVIGPWNYPVFTPMGSIAYALARRQRRRLQAQRVHARPSARGSPRPGAPPSRTPPTSSSWSPASARPARRCAVPASTSSPSPARPPPAGKVMAACAENLTPVLMECGGKDAMIVDDDADVVAAADAARVGRDEQRRADLHRHRAGLRDRAPSTTRFVAEVTEQVASCVPVRTTTRPTGR